MGSVRGVRRGKYAVKFSGIPRCALCNKFYKRKQSLIQHNLTTHLNHRTVCSICGKKYSSLSSHNRHLKKVSFIYNIHEYTYMYVCTTTAI